jgi:hypothetical protein
MPGVDMGVDPDNQSSKLDTEMPFGVLSAGGGGGMAGGREALRGITTSFNEDPEFEAPFMGELCVPIVAGESCDDNRERSSTMGVSIAAARLSSRLTAGAGDSN